MYDRQALPEYEYDATHRLDVADWVLHTTPELISRGWQMPPHQDRLHGQLTGWQNVCGSNMHGTDHGHSVGVGEHNGTYIEFNIQICRGYFYLAVTLSIQSMF